MKIKPLLVTTSLGTFLIVSSLVATLAFPETTREIAGHLVSGGPAAKVLIISFALVALFFCIYIKRNILVVRKILSGEATFSEINKIIFGGRKRKG